MYVYGMKRGFAVATRARAHRKMSTLRLNPTVLELPPSGIRDIMAAAVQLEHQTNSPVIHLEVGQPNFSTPDNVINACIDALKGGKTSYCPNAGIPELRQAVARKYNKQFPDSICSTENIMITSGSMLSLYSLYLTLFKPGDECLIPFPGFPNYQQGLSMVHAKPVPYPCHSNNGFIPAIADIEALIGPRTKGILICNPGNPTGVSYNMDLMEQMIQLARKHDLFVISDEIYAEIVFDSPHTSACLFQEKDINTSKLAVISGVSKSYAMTGFRVGWTRASAEIVENMSKLMEPVVSCSVPFTQWAAIEALEGSQHYVNDMVQQYKERRNRALEMLKERGREQSHTPGGAFYLPLDVTSITGLAASSKNGIKTSKDFAFKLLAEKRVAIAPGTAFDTSYEAVTCFHDNNNAVVDREEEGNTKDVKLKPHRQQRFVNRDYEKVLNSFCRISLASSTDNLLEGMNRICDFMDEHSNL